MFTDWVENHKGWDGGTAPYGKDGSSSILDLQLLWALQVATNLETKIWLICQRNDLQKQSAATAGQHKEKILE